jgi:hypothetical protein
MEYVYAALLLHKAGQDVSAKNMEAVLTAAGVKPDKGRIKALLAALEGVDIDDALMHLRRRRKKKKKKRKRKRSLVLAAFSDRGATTPLLLPNYCSKVEAHSRHIFFFEWRAKLENCLSP